MVGPPDSDEFTRLVLRMDIERTQTEAHMQMELDRLYTLQRLGNLVNATFNLEQILRAIVTAVVKELKFDHGLMYLGTEGDLQLRAWIGFEAEERDALGPRFARLLQRRVQETELPWLLETRDVSLGPDLLGVLESSGSQALVLVPVWSRQELVAGLVAGRLGRTPTVTPQDLEFLSLVATQTGIAVINSRLYRKVEQYSKNLEEQVSERTRELTAAWRDVQASKEQLVQAEKMAFLGQLTAGIAHEMNTPIGAVANSLKTLSDLAVEFEASIGSSEVTDDDYREMASEFKQSVAIADAALQKAAGFVRSLKTQTRDLANLEIRSFDPTQTLRDLTVLLSHEVRRTRCTLVTEIGSGVLLLRGDAGKFSQILTNLINNAMDSYDGREPGPIVVRLNRVAQYLVLDIEDQGCGISEANLPRVFREVFTTKWQGKGTGLGLSIVHGIVTGHFKGSIEVQSTENAGTHVRVRLPAQP